MTFALALLALAPAPQLATTTPPAAMTSNEVPRPDVTDAARRFLDLVDRSDWDASYRSTGSAFRKLNTLDVWKTVSKKVRADLGRMVSRRFVSQEDIPAPPAGYYVVKFRTDFTDKANALETVTLDREDGEWHVVGITVG